MNKRISFIIPTYNCAAFLDETLGSVLSQLPDNCELIVVDDGSSDDTPQRLIEYGENYRNLRLKLRSHEGVSGTRNAGLDMAEGEWVTFMDCDDLLKEGFFEKALSVLNDDIDLYIFSFERVEILGNEELVSLLMLKDMIFENTSDFADTYIRTRQLLVYSACNKLYRKSLLDEHKTRFRIGMSFGEDRLFNYDYLMYCGRIETSSFRMFRYMQRNPDSASKRSFPNYFDTVMMLHEAKMNCFLKLSEGTTQSEKRAFRGYDLSNEVFRIIERFNEYPEEKTENLPKINRLLFGDTDDISGRYDVMIVLGSRNCGYRAEKAFELAGSDPDTVFIVSGGNMHKDSDQTEAGFIADYLKMRGIDEERILIEDEATNTFQNLELSAKIIEDAVNDGRISGPCERLRIGIVTAGFHVPRTRIMASGIEWYKDKNIVFIPAYGEHTRPDNWYCDPQGRNIGLGEISKVCLVSNTAGNSNEQQ